MKRIHLAVSGGFTIDQYYLFDLKHNDKRNYLSEYDWFRSRLLNRPYDYVLNNKLLLSQIVDENIKVPTVFAMKLKGNFKTPDHCNLTEDDVISLVLDKKIVIIKPIFAGKGAGVFKVETIGNEKFYINGENANRKKLAEIIRENNNWMMCEYMYQHRYSQCICPSSVNTIRIIVVKNNNEFEIVYAVHRFGTKDTGVVDNGSKGGLVAKIDLETGILSEGRCLHNLNIYPCHPDTNSLIEGVHIPKWDQIKAEVLDVTSKFQCMKFIAWDVMLTDDNKVCLIEGNASSGVNILQLWEGQRNLKFGKFLKSNKVIK